MIETPVIDRLVRSRRRTLSLQVAKDGQLVVRAPKWGSLADIEKFVSKHWAWVREKQRAVLAARAERAENRFETGERFLFLGQEISLFVDRGSMRRLDLRPAGFVIGEAHQPMGKLSFERWYRARAVAVLRERVDLFSARWGQQVLKLKITGAKTRWGSCSSKGTLSFTWRLVMAPLWIVDYVVAHELAHLKHHNHSPRFWAEVALMFPHFKDARRWLRENQQRLSWEE